MTMKQQLISKLLYRYNGILKEVINQKDLFRTKSEYITTLLKYQQYINIIQSIQLNSLLIS